MYMKIQSAVSAGQVKKARVLLLRILQAYDKKLKVSLLSQINPNHG